MTGPRSLRAPSLAALVALASILGCSPVPDLGEATTEDMYEIGVQAAAREDYLLAVEAFRRVTIEAPMDDLADDALLALADAHRATRDFASAEEEYRRLVGDYPRSPLVPDAEYRLGLAFLEQSLPAALDQEVTNTAIAQFERFLRMYPESPLAPDARANMQELRERLAEKSFENARLYFTLGSPQAARIYLESIVREHPETVWARRALLEEARSFVTEGASESAATTYRRLMTLYPGSDEAAAAASEIAPLGQ